MKHTQKGDTLTVYLEGELDHGNSESYRRELETHLQNPKIRRLILNLSRLTFMDSSGIGVVLGRYNTISRRGGTVAVTGASPRVDKIFRMAGIYQIIEKLG